MSREIKFRAWIDDEYMVFSDMSKTHPYQDDEIRWNIQGGLEISTLDLKSEIIGGEVEQFEAFQARGLEGDKVLFMQYTGRLDDDKAEIYAGDIVDHYVESNNLHLDDWEIVTGPVLMINGQWCVKSEQYPLYGFRNKVIGNVHEQGYPK